MNPKARKLLEEIEAEYGLLASMMLRAERYLHDPLTYQAANAVDEAIGGVRLSLHKLHDQVIADCQNAIVSAGLD